MVSGFAIEKSKKISRSGGSIAEACGFGIKERPEVSPLKIAQRFYGAALPQTKKIYQNIYLNLLTNRHLCDNISAQQSRAAMRSHLTNKVSVRSID
jgi:hypothetical protein